MIQLDSIGLDDVRSVYSGPEARLWELIMGEQIHIGGLESSMDLARSAAIPQGSTGVDFCCCTGAGMRFLLRFLNVARMIGVDATENMIQLGRQRSTGEGVEDRVEFLLADVCDTGIPAASMDFVWGEDAWCYVEDKAAMIREAARILKPGGIVAFTDWVLGDKPMDPDEARRLLTFMKFPNLISLREYEELFNLAGITVSLSRDTGRFVPAVDLYLNMLGKQLTWDALKIIDFDQDLMNSMAAEMQFLGRLAREEKIIQGLCVARKS